MTFFYRSIAILHTMGERITSTIEWFLLVECCEELILQKFIDTIYKRKHISKLNVGRVTLCNTENYLSYYHVLKVPEFNISVFIDDS